LAVRKQVGRVLAAVVALGAAVSGCGNQAGTAVIVGGDAVPIERIQDRLDVALAKTDVMAAQASQGNGPDNIARLLVTTTVTHDLLQREAAAAGIAVSDAEVDTLINTASEQHGGVDAFIESTPFDLAGVRELARDQIAQTKLGAKTVGGLTVTVDILTASSRPDAERKAQTLAAGGPAADALFANPQTSRRGAVYAAAAHPEDAGDVMYGARVGSTVAYQKDPDQANWTVFRVVDRRTDAPSDPLAVNRFSQDELLPVGHRSLQPSADALGVDVNPRFGVWDPIRLSVVPKDMVGGKILPPQPAAG
jgi:hypothetical protein